jgi:hypothetical protein
LIEDEKALKLSSGEREKNWPPFSTSCPKPFKPCFHHDFKGEIPDWGYKAIKHVYWSWFLYFVCLAWNMIASVASAGNGRNSCIKEPGRSAWLGVVMFIIFVPCSYCCWFQPLYQAMRKDSSLRFGWFFLCYFLQFVSSALFASGFFQGGAGWVRGIKLSKCDKVVSAMYFLSAACWSALAIYNFFLLHGARFSVCIVLLEGGGYRIHSSHTAWLDCMATPHGAIQITCGADFHTLTGGTFNGLIAL